jgi:hypothetical protein
MAITSKGYDPALGAKFSEENGGLVIGRSKAPSLKTDEQVDEGYDEDEEAERELAEEQALQEFGEEYGRNPDAQELFDWMNR